MLDDPDRAPDMPPRVIGIYWTPGEDPVLEAHGFADWEVKAVLQELLNQYVNAEVDEEADT